MLSLILKLKLIIHLKYKKKGLKNLKFKTFLIKLFYFFLFKYQITLNLLFIIINLILYH